MDCIQVCTLVLFIQVYVLLAPVRWVFSYFRKLDGLLSSFLCLFFLPIAILPNFSSARFSLRPRFCKIQASSITVHFLFLGHIKINFNFIFSFSVHFPFLNNCSSNFNSLVAFHGSVPDPDHWKETKLCNLKRKIMVVWLH